MFNHLEPRIGFRYTLWSIALVVLVCVLLASATLRMRDAPKQTRQIFDRRALHEPAFVIWGIYLFVSLLGLYLPSFFIQLYTLQYVPSSLALNILPVLNAGSFVGRIVSYPSPFSLRDPTLASGAPLTTNQLLQIPLYFADKLGPLNVGILLTAVGGILAFSWIAIRTEASIVVFCVLYGFFAGAITTVTAVIDAALCPTLDVVGVRTGMLLVPWALGLLVGEPIGGVILASRSGWTGLQTFAGATVTMSIGLALLVRGFKYGWGWKMKC